MIGFRRDWPVFEPLMVLFLFAGRFKGDPRLAWVPVDLTALFFGLSVLVGGLLLYANRFRLPLRGLRLVGATLPLLLWISASLLWTPGEDYARQKTLYAWTLLLWPLVASALILAPDRRRLRRFVLSIVVLSAVLALDVLNFAAGKGVRNLMFLLGSAYLGLGRAIGLGANAAWCFACREATPPRIRALWAGLAALLLFTLLIMGGRGPLLSAAAGLLAPLAVALFRPDVRRGAARYVKATLLGLALVTVSIGAFSLSGLTPRTLERTGSLFTEEADDHSSAERLRYYDLAIRHWRGAPVTGNGIGSFPVLIERGDSTYYPHNLLLEMLVELGIVGVGLLLLPLLVGGLQLGLARLGRDPWRLLALTLFVNTLVNAQVSEDLTGNRLLFAALGLLALAPADKDPS